MNYNLIHSLHKDTLVNINGSSVKLETIQLGDLVQGRDLANGVNRDNRVTQIATGTLHQYLKFKLSDGSTLKTSVDIKIYKNGEWVSPINNESCGCSDCKCGSNLFYNDLSITSIELVEEDIEVVSITVEPDHNYFVGNLLVHNTGPQGSKGQKGQKGQVGPQGPTGPQGGAGPQGAQGAGGGSGSTGAQGASNQGPQGAQGSAGSSPQGAQGATGAQGPQGAQGASSQGPTGAAGAKGDQGAQGSSPTGPKGATGPQGPQGAQGSSPQGATGATGPQGPQGAQGASPTGPKGATGATGPQGAQGLSVQGAQGAGGIKGQKGESALGTTIANLPSGGFEFSTSDNLLTFTSGSFKGVVLMYTSGSI